MKRVKCLAWLALLAMILPLVVSCAAPTPQVVEKVVTQQVEKVVTQVVEKEKVVEKVATQVVEKKAARGGSIVYTMNREPDSLDPHVSSSRYDRHVELQVYDTLVCYNPEDKTYKPSLATSWEIAPDGKSVTLKLRKDVKFHDGTPFNAQAVKENLVRIFDPATKSESSKYLLGPLDVNNIEVIDDYTVKLNYTKPNGAITYGLAGGSHMISPAAIKQYGQKLYNNMVGTGPFKFVEWVQRDRIVLVKNPDFKWANDCYINKGPAYLDKVTIKFVAENNTRMATLQTGESQLVRSVPPDSWPQWSGNPKFKTAITPQGGIGGNLDLNVKKFPTDDLKVRQALNYLIDKKEISLGAFGGLYQPSYGVLSPVTIGYEPKSELYKFDPKKGEALLDEAGWKLNPKTGKREKDGQVLKLEYLTLTGVQNVAVIVKGLLEEYGIEVNILAEDNPAQQSDAQQGKHNIVWIGWAGTEPDLLKQLFACENVGTGWNFSHYCNPQADELMSKAESEINPEKRYQYYKDVQVKIMEDAAVVPLYVVGLTWAMVPDLMGFRTLAGEQIMLHEMYRLLE